jgi:hypothetical protein
MLEAHVRFELERLTGDGLDETVRTEVEALLGWLDQVSLDDLASAEMVSEAVLAWVDTLSESQLQQHVTDTLLWARESLAQAPESVADVLTREDAARWATALAGMDDARNELLEQITTSKAYSHLVAHVVYRGVKSYLLTENVLAKRIPGASSLVRLGQRGLGAAAPGLEQNVDRQLIAFVDANIADTVRDSRRFIDGMIDEQTVASASGEAWDAAADRPVATAATLLTDDEVGTLAELVGQQWSTLRETDLVRRTISDCITSFFEAHGSRPVADLLDEVGVTAQVVTESLLPLARSSVQHAADTGYLEQRVRARLAAFYDGYGT